MMGGAGELVQQVAAPAVSLWDSVWLFVRAELRALPDWARVGLVVFAIVSAIACRWIIPALAELARAKGGGK
jgi:hypothetical protein